MYTCKSLRTLQYIYTVLNAQYCSYGITIQDFILKTTEYCLPNSEQNWNLPVGEMQRSTGPTASL